MARNAKDYAREQLGNLDLSHLDKEKEVANSIYDTSKSTLENNFNNLLGQIESNRADTRKNFDRGRNTIAENSFMQNKMNEESLASRGVGVGGLKKLGEVGNRMETGRQYSNLANEFYNTMSDLKTTEDRGRTQYDLDKQGLKNTLDQTLAGIESRGNEAQNNYNMSLGQLAESIQGRWDANANAQKALQQQQAAQAQAHRDALNAAKQNLKAMNEQALQEITSSNASADNKIAALMARFNIDSNMAANILQQLNLYTTGITTREGNVHPYTGYQDNYDYVSALKGSW